MAFVCVADSRLRNAEILHSDGEHAILARIGYDLEVRANYFAHIGFCPLIDESYEYYFYLVEVFSISNKKHIHWSGADTTKFIHKHDRRVILNVVLQATRAIIEHLYPACVFRCTNDPGPPVKALKKHELITEVFESYGYTTRIATPYVGRLCWWMTRLEPA